MQSFFDLDFTQKNKKLLTEIKALVDHGANPSVKNNAVLKLASLHGHLDVVKYLVETAKIDLSQNDEIAWKWAVGNKHTDVANYLFETFHVKFKPFSIAV